MIDLVFRSTRGDQLLVGAFLLVAGTLIMPMLAGLLFKIVVSLNTAMFGPLADWHVQGFKWLGAFFALGSAFMAVQGAIYLSLAAAATAGLVRAPWQ